MSEQFLQARLFRFAVVGVLGFCVDGGLLTLLMISGWDVLWARCCSFSLAVTITWFFNRLWTFNTRKQTGMKKEYLAYFFIQFVGAGINLSLFFILLDTHPFFRSVPLIPLAAGAGVSLMFTFLVSRNIVFRSSPAEAVPGTALDSNKGRYYKR